jgi:hypothetical protein
MTKPRVSAQRATLGRDAATIPNPNGVVYLRRLSIPRSLAQLYHHLLIGSTKNRIPFLRQGLREGVFNPVGVGTGWRHDPGWRAAR